MKSLIALMTLGALIVGCGAGEFDNGEQGRGASDLTAVLGCGPKTELPADGTAAAAAPALSRAPAEHLAVRTVDGDQTLCEAMRAGGKSITVLAFTDVACVECQAKVKELSDAFAAEAMAPHVQTFAIVVQDAKRSDVEAAGANAEAESATWINDRSRRVWRFFNPDPANDAGPATAVAVVLDAEARGWIAKDGEDAATLWGQMLAAYRDDVVE